MLRAIVFFITEVLIIPAAVMFLGTTAIILIAYALT
jgi:hypothetical protein